MTVLCLFVATALGQEVPPVPFAPAGAAGGPPVKIQQQQASVALPGSVTPSQHHKQCKWTSPDGFTFDLSPLQKPDGVDDWDVNFEKQRFRLKINVCSNVDESKLPSGCQGEIGAGKFSPVWQTNEPGKSCYYLGNLAKPSWYLIDKTKPTKGVVLTYTDGQKCGAYGSRQVSLHMICASNFVTEEAPSYAYESPTCHYHVIWPTLHACPMNPGAASFGRALLSLVMMYFICGSAYNAYANGKSGINMIPHLEAIKWSFSMCKSVWEGVVNVALDFISKTVARGGRGANKSGSGSSERDIEKEALQPMTIGGDSL